MSLSQIAQDLLPQRRRTVFLLLGGLVPALLLACPPSQAAFFRVRGWGGSPVVMCQPTCGPIMCLAPPCDAPIVACQPTCGPIICFTPPTCESVLDNPDVHS